MARPDLVDVHADQPLTDFSSAAFQDEGAFAWRDFAPIKPTDKQSNTYVVFDRGDFFRSEARQRAPGTKVALRDYKLSRDTYLCDRYAVGAGISEEEMANADPGIDLEQTTAAVLAQDLNIRAEILMTTAFLDTASVWGADTTPGTLWDDDASAPLKDIATEHAALTQAIGRPGNTILCGAEVFFKLMNHPDLLARLPDNKTRIIGQADLAGLFGVDRFLVTFASQTTSQEGLTDTFAYIGGDHLVLAYVDPTPGLRTPTAAVTFSWTGLTGASPSGIRTKRIMLPAEDQLPLIESDFALDFVAVSSVAGRRLAQVIA